jgi:hypothetical protein
MNTIPEHKRAHRELLAQQMAEYEARHPVECAPPTEHKPVVLTTLDRKQLQRFDDRSAKS